MLMKLPLFLSDLYGGMYQTDTTLPEHIGSVRFISTDKGDEGIDRKINMERGEIIHEMTQITRKIEAFCSVKFKSVKGLLGHFEICRRYLKHLR